MADKNCVNSENKTGKVPQQKKHTVANRKAAGANWSAVNNNNNNSNNKENANHIKIKQPPKAKSAATPTTNKEEKEKETAKEGEPATTSAATQKKTARRKRAKWGNRHVAMDCEMVGIYKEGHADMLARVSIVNRHGNVLLDKYVKPTAKVVDYRTQVSGIRPQDIENGEDFHVVQAQVIQILEGKVLVGHGLRKDLQVLNITHPQQKVRDTASYKALARVVNCGRTPSLKRLANCLLGEQIQSGEHDSVEDAKAAMKIYNVICESWEEALQKKYR